MKSQFFKSSSWSFSAVVFRALGSLTVNKLFAVFLGTNGITLLAHFQNLISLFTLLPSEGVNRGIMKYWSDPELSEAVKKRLFQTGLWMTSGLMVTVLGVIYWQKAYFFDRFTGTFTIVQFLLAFIPSIFLILVTGLLNAVILSRRDVKGYALINITGVLLLVGVVYMGVSQDSLGLALLSLPLGHVLMFVPTVIYFLRKKNRVSIRLSLPDQKSFRMIWSFILMAVSTILFGQLLDFEVREHIIELFGTDRTGLWQAVAKMSTNYLLVFTGTVGVVYYPRMSSLIHEHYALRSYVLKVMGYVGFITLICLGIYFLNKEFLLKLFFAEGFEQASYLVRYQAIGDFFCILSYLLAYLLSAQVATWKYIIAQLFSAGIYISLISTLLETLNLEALTVAYMARYIGFFLILIYFNRKLLFK